MSVYITDVGNVVAFLFHPKCQGKFPKQELARSLGQGGIQDLAILPIGTVPARAHPRPPVPFFLAVVVERPLAGPTVVGGPGGVAALKEPALPWSPCWTLWPR